MADAQTPCSIQRAVPIRPNHNQIRPLGKSVPVLCAIHVRLYEPLSYFSIMSANDASIAPPGQDVLYLYGNVPVDPVGG
jgi:hypothetical protein